MSENLAGALRFIAGALEMPVAAILLLLMAASLFLLGTLAVELFTERMRLKTKLPELADRLRAAKADEMGETISGSGLLRRQKEALIELTRHPALTPAMRDALAVKLIHAEREHYESVVRASDSIARLGPMFGLLGTLIPLGPGIIALGRGDTYTLSLSMLTAFDTTIAGLVAAAMAFAVSAARKKWYAGYMATLEMVAECVLERINLPEVEEREKET
jgi:biopolymer transport protein ExbB/TolQ